MEDKFYHKGNQVYITFKGTYKPYKKEALEYIKLYLNIEGKIRYSYDNPAKPIKDRTIEIDKDVLLYGRTCSMGIDDGRKGTIQAFYQGIVDAEHLLERQILDTIEREIKSIVVKDIEDGHFNELKFEVESKLDNAKKIKIGF